MSSEKCTINLTGFFNMSGQLDMQKVLDNNEIIIFKIDEKYYDQIYTKEDYELISFFYTWVYPENKDPLSQIEMEFKNRYDNSIKNITIKRVNESNLFLDDIEIKILKCCYLNIIKLGHGIECLDDSSTVLLKQIPRKNNYQLIYDEYSYILKNDFINYLNMYNLQLYMRGNLLYINYIYIISEKDNKFINFEIVLNKFGQFINKINPYDSEIPISKDEFDLYSEEIIQSTSDILDLMLIKII